jgi:GDPmannose 4,6-dehydratase
MSLQQVRQYSVKEFVNYVQSEILNIPIIWKGKGLDEAYGINKDNNRVIIKINKEYFRPTEVETLLGDSNKAKKELKWKPKISFKNLVKEMTLADFNNLKKK